MFKDGTSVRRLSAMVDLRGRDARATTGLVLLWCGRPARKKPIQQADRPNQSLNLPEAQLVTARTASRPLVPVKVPEWELARNGGSRHNHRPYYYSLGGQRHEEPKPGMNRIFTTTAVAAVLIICIGVPILAQETGEIHGRIVDYNDLPLPGVTIAIQGQATRSVLSTVDGRFRASNLLPGTLNLTVAMPGFITIEEIVELTAGATVEIDFQMHPAFEKTVIVSASRTKVLLEDTPTTISVIGRNTIETRPAQNIGDLMREVPGANVVQSSARDVNVATRGPSPFLTGSQLALVDGRPLYFDFFNVIFWDLSAVQTNDIEQIEVVRGPASTMWGANAATGVVNMVTRAPRTSQGLEFAVIGGLISRSSEAGGTGAMGSLNIRWADAPTDKLAYRLSAGVYYSDPLERPTGMIPEVLTPIDPPVLVGGGSYDDVFYDNNGTLQPKFDLRIDQELEGEGRILYSTGIAYTEGIIQTPIGPFDAQRGTKLAYGQIAYHRGSFRIRSFANYIRGGRRACSPSMPTSTRFGSISKTGSTMSMPVGAIFSAAGTSCPLAATSATTLSIFPSPRKPTIGSRSAPTSRTRSGSRPSPSPWLPGPTTSRISRTSTSHLVPP